MNETLHLEGLEFRITRSARRRTVGLAVERNGLLAAAVPTDLPIDRVEAVVRSKLFWVFSKLAEKELVLQPERERAYITGEGFYYLGRSYRLLLADDKDGHTPPSLSLSGGRFLLARRDQRQAAELFKRWYTDRGNVWITRRVDQLAARVGVRPKGIRVMELGNRWGSCSESGILNFHWRAVRLPPSLIEYVAAHELVHLLVPRHDAEFWERLERVMPDYRLRKSKLATEGGRY